MLKKTCIILGLLWLAIIPAVAAETAYSVIIEDLPLMSGMTEQTDDAVVFDKPGGRIVGTIVKTAARAADVKRFYAEALPSLGWKPLSPLGFVREGEVLNLDIEQKEEVTIVYFNLTPNSTGK